VADLLRELVHVHFLVVLCVVVVETTSDGLANEGDEGFSDHQISVKTSDKHSGDPAETVLERAGPGGPIHLERRGAELVADPVQDAHAIVPLSGHIDAAD